MPTYDYRCGACEHEVEIFHSMSDAPKRKCPECGRLKLVRQIGAGGGILFKGSGFYQTDYRSDSYKKGAKAETSSSAESKSSDKSSKSSDKSSKSSDKSSKSESASKSEPKGD